MMWGDNEVQVIRLCLAHLVAGDCAAVIIS